jgi:PIN domain nuclease of toxin-antitoxin system
MRREPCQVTVGRPISPISLLEMAVKLNIGKLAWHAPFAELLPAQLTANRILLVAIDSFHAEQVATLPLHTAIRSIA